MGLCVMLGYVLGDSSHKDTENRLQGGAQKCLSSNIFMMVQGEHGMSNKEISFAIVAGSPVTFL